MDIIVLTHKHTGWTHSASYEPNPNDATVENHVRVKCQDRDDGVWGGRNKSLRPFPTHVLNHLGDSQARGATCHWEGQQGLRHRATSHCLRPSLNSQPVRPSRMQQPLSWRLPHGEQSWREGPRIAGSRAPQPTPSKGPVRVVGCRQRQPRHRRKMRKDRKEGRAPLNTGYCPARLQCN